MVWEEGPEEGENVLAGDPCVSGGQAQAPPALQPLRNNHRWNR